MADKIKIEVLGDGTIKTLTDTVSMPNHANSEAFLREVGRLAGGKIESKHRHGGIGHSHTHGEREHSHDHHNH